MLLTTKYSKQKRMTPQKEWFDLWQWAQNLDDLPLGDLVWIPYSGKFSLGANFRNFRRLIGNCKNKNREKMNPGRPENLDDVTVMHVHAYYRVEVWILCGGDGSLSLFTDCRVSSSPRGPLSIWMSPASIQEANKAARNAPKRSKSKVTYSKLMPEQQVQIAKLSLVSKLLYVVFQRISVLTWMKAQFVHRKRSTWQKLMPRKVIMRAMLLWPVYDT